MDDRSLVVDKSRQAGGCTEIGDAQGGKVGHAGPLA
jgi:hypothetical protein